MIFRYRPGRTKWLIPASTKKRPRNHFAISSSRLIGRYDISL